MKDHFGALDGVRGLAALYVLIHHARLALTQPFMNGLSIHPEQYNWIDTGMVYFFSLFKFAQEAVIIFFVLSGFVIHLRQAKNPNYRDFNVVRYLKNRIIRIYPTLIFSIILCVLLDYLLLLISKDHFSTILEKYNYIDFFTNFFLIPESNAWGNNFPIWSLKHEWLFYLSYPFLFWLYSKHKVIPLLFVIFCFLSYLFGIRIPYIGPVAYTILVWILGVVLAEIYVYKTALVEKYIPYLLLLLFLYPFIKHNNKNFPFLYLTFGLITTGFLYVILKEKIGYLNIILRKFSNLGFWSYSIYLLHMPLINTYQFLLFHITNQQVLPYHLWHVALAIVIILPIIYILYYFTERLATQYKKKIL